MTDPDTDELEHDEAGDANSVPEAESTSEADSRTAQGDNEPEGGFFADVDHDDEPERRWLTPLCATVAIGAVVFALVSGLVWWRNTHNAAVATASARDAALNQARIDVATLNTMNYHDPQASLARWAAVTTGALHTQIEQGSAGVTKAISAAKISSKAVVLAAAVTTVDVKHGTATVIASVQLTKTPDASASVVDRNRVKASLVRVGSTWRLSDLAPVRVQLS